MKPISTTLLCLLVCTHAEGMHNDQPFTKLGLIVGCAAAVTGAATIYWYHHTPEQQAAARKIHALDLIAQLFHHLQSYEFAAMLVAASRCQGNQATAQQIFNQKVSLFAATQGFQTMPLSGTAYLVCSLHTLLSNLDFTELGVSYDTINDYIVPLKAHLEIVNTYLQNEPQVQEELQTCEADPTRHVDLARTPIMRIVCQLNAYL